MSALAFYKRLRDVGMDEATAMQAAEAFEQELKLALDAVLEPRRAKDRARKAAKAPQTSAESTETAETEESISTPALETKVSPTPPSKTQSLSPSKNPPKGGQKGSRRCPASWEPSEETVSVLTEEGYASGELERALSMVRDHEFKTPRTDWDATFRNWVRRDSPAPRKAHERPHTDPKFLARHANFAAAAEGARRMVEARRAGRADGEDVDAFWADPGA